jgi:hypothetical protein
MEFTKCNIDTAFSVLHNKMRIEIHLKEGGNNFIVCENGALVATSVVILVKV